MLIRLSAEAVDASPFHASIAYLASASRFSCPDVSNCTEISIRGGASAAVQQANRSPLPCHQVLLIASHASFRPRNTLMSMAAPMTAVKGRSAASIAMTSV